MNADDPTWSLALEKLSQVTFPGGSSLMVNDAADATSV
jgi:hypothetical protein